MAEPRGDLARLLRLLALPESLLSPLLAHAEAVQRDSPRLGLVSRSDERTVVARHTIDSLGFALVRRPEPAEAWVDVGSGAGFPGLVLAICYPRTRFTLVEANRKKAGFLEMQTLELGLDNVLVWPERVGTLRERFDVAVARALAEPAEALATLRGLLRAPGGMLVIASSETGIPGVKSAEMSLPGGLSPGKFLVGE